MVISIQYMRAIAALLVVISHAASKGAQYSYNPMGWFKIGDIGVDLFFVISGYIMCHVTYNKRINFRQFMKSRFIRILPLYWFLTIVALIIYILYPDKVNSSGGDTSVIYSFLLFPTSDHYLVANGWTLAYEFYFYFLFATGLLFSNILRYAVPMVILLSLIGIGLMVDTDNYQLKFLFNIRLSEFLFGMWAFYFFSKHSLSQVLSVLLILASVIILAVVNFTGGIYNEYIDYAVPVIFFFFGMRGLESELILASENHISKLLKAIGDSSYSLYLFHPFILVLLSMLFNKVGITEYGYVFILLLVVFSVLAGQACYQYIELTINKEIKKYFRPA